jgi:molybdopterin/thiamine biosynthesis adenylyltransferase
MALDALPDNVRRRPLSGFGLRDGDVLRLEQLEQRGGATQYLVHAEPPVPVGPGRVLIAGCGGNIGSSLVPLVARLPGVVELTLCDPDVYEAHQVAGQNVLPQDVGRNKALVQAERVAAIAPHVAAIAVAAPLESLPWTAFRGAIVVSALDSRLARVRLAERAWRMGAPFVDSAVEASGSLSRVEVYRPGRGEPCFECGLDDAAYEALAHEFPCDGRPAHGQRGQGGPG